MRLTNVKLFCFCALAWALAAPAAAAPLPGPVTADDAEISTSTLLEQLASLPDFTVNPDSAPVSESDLMELEEGEDADTYIFISSALAQAPEPVNLGGNGSLTLTRYDNGEKLTVRYRRKDGTYDQDALARLDRHMRCSLTGRETHMSVKLVELLDAVEDHFGKRGLVLLSGYRTPKNNGRTSGAVKHSLHMLGWAADIRIPGYSSTKVKNFGRRLRAGGVGYYPYKGFTHLDVGKLRYWSVTRPPRRHRIRLRRAKPSPRVARKARPAAVRHPAARAASRPALKTRPAALKPRPAKAASSKKSSARGS